MVDDPSSSSAEAHPSGNESEADFRDANDNDILTLKTFLKPHLNDLVYQFFIDGTCPTRLTTESLASYISKFMGPLNTLVTNSLIAGKVKLSDPQQQEIIDWIEEKVIFSFSRYPLETNLSEINVGISRMLDQYQRHCSGIMQNIIGNGAQLLRDHLQQIGLLTTEDKPLKPEQLERIHTAAHTFYDDQWEKANQEWGLNRFTIKFLNEEVQRLTPQLIPFNRSLSPLDLSGNTSQDTITGNVSMREPEDHRERTLNIGHEHNLIVALVQRFTQARIECDKQLDVFYESVTQERDRIILTEQRRQVQSYLGRLANNKILANLKNASNRKSINQNVDAQIEAFKKKKKEEAGQGIAMQEELERGDRRAVIKTASNFLENHLLDHACNSLRNEFAELVLQEGPATKPDDLKKKRAIE